jgi:tetratricopeptide (TPR) repeat protein
MKLLLWARNVLLRILFALLLGTSCLAFSAGTSSAENLLDTGISEYKNENFEEAQAIFLKAKGQGKDLAMVSFYLGLSYKQTGNYKEAAASLREAVSLAPPVNDAYPELIEVLYLLEELKEAKDWMAKAEKANIKPASMAYLNGLILAKEGNNSAAVESLKRAKELDSTFAQKVDLQLAAIYAGEKRFADAKQSLRAVIDIDPSSEMASYAREYEQAVARGMEAHKTWRISAGVAFQYDDNVVLKPSSGVGASQISGERDGSVVATFQVDYTAPIQSSTFFFKGQYALYSNTYFHTFEYDLLSQAVTLMPGFNIQNGAVVVPVRLEHTMFNERGYLNLLSVKPMLHLVLAPGHIGQFSAGYTKQNFLSLNGSGPEDRDDDIYSVSLGYLHPFSGGKGLFNARYEYLRDDAAGRNWENTGNRFTMGILFPIVQKVSLALSGEALLQDYSNEHTVYDKKRRDKTYVGSAVINWEVSSKVNLIVQYIHTTVDSNIPLYDYKRNVYSAGLTYNF